MKLIPYIFSVLVCLPLCISAQADHLQRYLLPNGEAPGYTQYSPHGKRLIVESGSTLNFHVMENYHGRAASGGEIYYPGQLFHDQNDCIFDTSTGKLLRTISHLIELDSRNSIPGFCCFIGKNNRVLVQDFKHGFELYNPSNAQPPHLIAWNHYHHYLYVGSTTVRGHNIIAFLHGTGINSFINRKSIFSRGTPICLWDVQTNLPIKLKYVGTSRISMQGQSLNSGIFLGSRRDVPISCFRLYHWGSVPDSYSVISWSPGGRYLAIVGISHIRITNDSKWLIAANNEVYYQGVWGKHFAFSKQMLKIPVWRSYSISKYETLLAIAPGATKGLLQLFDKSPQVDLKEISLSPPPLKRKH